VWADLRALHPELKLTDWEAAHLWGPGFGDEAAAGMMLAPKDVNQVWQNRGVEKFLRELRGMAGDQGLIVRVRAVARSHPRTFAGGMGDSLLQSVQYDFTVEAPGQSPRPYGQVSFSVGTPPGGVVSEPVVVEF
jgi:Bacterial toxin 4